MLTIAAVTTMLYALLTITRPEPRLVRVRTVDLRTGFPSCPCYWRTS